MALTTSLLLCTTAIFAQNSNPWPTSGNVGIGTSSPSSPLMVFSFQANLTNPVTDIAGSSTLVSGVQARDILSVRILQPNFTLKTEFVVRNNGNVGIGTSTPSTTLEVVGNAQFTTAATTGLATLNSLNVTNNSIINGNVGIGVANPLEKLDIAGNIKLNNNVIYLRGNYDYNHGLRWCGSSAPFASVTTIDGPVLFGWSGGMLGTTAGGQKAVLRWNSAGQVSIGTGKPVTGAFNNFALSVDGTIVSRRVVVQVSDWADKVFSAGYNLKPLAEVEEYINANKHLPEIPSEQEVKELGIDVSDMNKLLLQKVEELTLHIIAQQKQIDELKKK